MTGRGRGRGRPRRGGRRRSRLLSRRRVRPERYFTDAPFIEGGLTYVLTKMWGRGTEPALSALRDTFATAGVSFQAED